jgi:hypothetical protein
MSSASPPSQTGDAAAHAAARRARGHVRSSAKGRTCSAPDCQTALSRYNHDTLCWVHAAELDDERRRRS